MSGPERERLGQCMADLKLALSSAESVLSDAGKQHWRYDFYKQIDGDCGGDKTSVLSTMDLRQHGIPEGDLVVLSVEGEPRCLRAALKHLSQTFGELVSLKGAGLSLILQESIPAS